MSGGVPPSSRAGRRGKSASRQTTVAARKAADLYERFSGHDAEVLGRVKLPDLPEAAAVMGVCDGILYTTVRDGVEEKYIHKFRKSDAPLMAVSPDGKQILLIGGRYVFTDRGIVDLSDKKNLPKGYRNR